MQPTVTAVYWWFARDVTAAMLVVTNKSIFPPLGTKLHFDVDYWRKNSTADCKTVGFFLKISKKIGKAWRKSPFQTDLLFDCSCVLEYLKIPAVLQSNFVVLITNTPPTWPPCHMVFYHTNIQARLFFSRDFPLKYNVNIMGLKRFRKPVNDVFQKWRPR